MMKPSVLLINCYKSPDDERIKSFFDWLSPHFEVNTLHIDKLKSTNVKEDAVVVSGSERLLTEEPVPLNLKNLMLEITKPVLGVCYGHQALAAAWGAKIVRKKFLEENETIRVEHSEELLYNMGLFFTAYESHAEHVLSDHKLSNQFKILAFSDSCKVEIIRHKERPMWGVQFHPERSGSTGNHLAINFLHIVTTQGPDS